MFFFTDIKARSEIGRSCFKGFLFFVSPCVLFVCVYLRDFFGFVIQNLVAIRMVSITDLINEISESGAELVYLDNKALFDVFKHSWRQIIAAYNPNTTNAEEFSTLCQLVAFNFSTSLWKKLFKTPNTGQTYDRANDEDGDNLVVWTWLTRAAVFKNPDHIQLFKGKRKWTLPVQKAIAETLGGLPIQIQNYHDLSEIVHRLVPWTQTQFPHRNFYATGDVVEKVVIMSEVLGTYAHVGLYTPDPPHWFRTLRTPIVRWPLSTNEWVNYYRVSFEQQMIDVFREATSWRLLHRDLSKYVYRQQGRLDINLWAAAHGAGIPLDLQLWMVQYRELSDQQKKEFIRSILYVGHTLTNIIPLFLVAQKTGSPFLVNEMLQACIWSDTDLDFVARETVKSGRWHFLSLFLLYDWSTVPEHHWETADLRQCKIDQLSPEIIQRLDGVPYTALARLENLRLARLEPNGPENDVPAQPLLPATKRLKEHALVVQQFVEIFDNDGLNAAAHLEKDVIQTIVNTPTDLDYILSMAGLLRSNQDDLLKSLVALANWFRVRLPHAFVPKLEHFLRSLEH